MFLTELSNAFSRFRMIFLSVFLASTIILSAVLFLMDRTSRAKAIKIRKELEGITNVGPYLLREKIAEGGMAELFLADYIHETFEMVNIVNYFQVVFQAYQIIMGVPCNLIP